MPSSQMLLLLIALTGLTCVGMGLVLIVLGVGMLMRKPPPEETNTGFNPSASSFYDEAPTDPRG